MRSASSRQLYCFGPHLQQASAYHVFHSAVYAPVQIDAGAVEEKAAEVVVQGGFNVQIKLPQGPPSAEQDLQNPV